MAKRYLGRIESWTPLRRPRGDARTIAVLVTPWMKTAVPFFSIELARVMAEEGWNVVAIFDGTDIVDNSRSGGHIDALRSILEAANGWLGVQEFEPKQALAEDFDIGERLAHANAIRNMRGEEFAKEFHERRPEAARKLADHFRGAYALLADLRPDRLLIPGGIYGLSGCYVEAAKQLGIFFQTFDSGPGILRLCQNGIAAHLGDIPAAFAALSEIAKDPAVEQKILEIADREFDDRNHCRDFRHFQTVPKSGGGAEYTLLVPLNISWDTAALGLKTAFPSVKDWLAGLMDWLRRNPGTTMCVRQHPRERLGFVRSRDDLGDFVKGFPDMEGRVRYVRAEEEVNTYDLLANASVVLPHSSTFGIEAAFSGKPVVVPTSCYYSNLGFVKRGLDPESYFRAIDESLRYATDEGQRRKAGLAYFLTQRCAYLKTVFTPMPDAFGDWCGEPSASLWNREELADLRSALLSGEPLPLVRARRLMHS